MGRVRGAEKGKAVMDAPLFAGVRYCQQVSALGKTPNQAPVIASEAKQSIVRR
jgi:hypothetical protein